MIWWNTKLTESEARFGGATDWNLCNELARNVVIFRVDNNISSYSKHKSNVFMVLRKELSNIRNFAYQTDI